MSAPSVEIFAVVRDEENFLPFFYNHYKSRLSNVSFTLVDVGSKDRTVELARDLGMHIHQELHEDFRDSYNMHFKNNCWKTSAAEFFIIQDLDELLDVDDNFLEAGDFSIVFAECWDMIGEGQALQEISRGVRLPLYDKPMLYRKSHFIEINTGPGAHIGRPTYQNFVKNPILVSRPMFHYNRISTQHLLSKYQSRKMRLSSENLAKGWGRQYLMTEEQIVTENKRILEQSIEVRPRSTHASGDFIEMDLVISFFRKYFGSIARIVLDLGCRDGEDAQYVSERLNSQIVVAVEARFSAAEQMKQKFPNWRIVNKALGDYEGKTAFTELISPNKDVSGSSAIESWRFDHFECEKRTYEIPITTMSRVLRELNLSTEILDIVKIDCEGFSYQVLAGFNESLDQIRLLHVETETESTHSNHFDNKSIENFLRSKGFILLDQSSKWGHPIVDQIWINSSKVLFQNRFLPG